MRYDPTEEIYIRCYLRKTLKKDLSELVTDGTLTEKESAQLCKDAQNAIPETLTLLLIKTLKVQQECLNVDKQILETQQEILNTIKQRNKKGQSVDTSTETEDNSPTL